MRRLRRLLLCTALFGSVLCCLALQITLLGTVLFQGVKAFDTVQMGAVSLPALLVNTLYLAVVSLLLVFPVALGCGVWLFWYAKSSLLKSLLQFSLEALSAIPSVVYGLFGFLIFSAFLQLRYSLLSGSLTMAVLLLPVLVKAIGNALLEVEHRYLDSALALGASPSQVVSTMLIPCAKKGIGAALVLALARILAESAPLVLTAGLAMRLPQRGWISHLFSSGATLAVGIYAQLLEGNIDAAFVISAMILLLLILLRLIGRIFCK